MAPADFKVPAVNELEAALPALIHAAEKHFASPPVTTTFMIGEKKQKEAKAKKEKAS